MILLGCLGGILPDILRLIKNRYEIKVPEYFKSVFFWISLFLMVIVGGLAAWLLEANNAKQALAYGFSAPEILSKLFGKLAEGADRGDEKQEGKKVSSDLFAWWNS